MNRILKQRFNQISRQNTYLFVTRGATPQKVESSATKMMPARPLARPESLPADLRRV
jgi:hypothetical protein